MQSGFQLFRNDSIIVSWMSAHTCDVLILRQETNQQDYQRERVYKTDSSSLLHYVNLFYWFVGGAYNTQS